MSRADVFASGTAAGLEPAPVARERRRSDPGRRLAARADELLKAIPLAWRLAGIGLGGAVAASLVGWLAARNPSASPAHFAGLVRVLVIVSMIGAGLYAHTSRLQARMGALLTASGFYAAVWLLNGAHDRALFSVGLLATGVAPVLLAYQILVHPTGHLRSAVERRFFWCSGAVVVALWVVSVLVAQQPPFKTPLVQCVPHCQSNALSTGSLETPPAILKALIMVGWIAILCTTAWFVARRTRLASPPMRRAMAPVLFISMGAAVTVVLYLLALALGLGIATALGAAFFTISVAIPLGILVGLVVERLYLADSLTAYLEQLARAPNADPEALIAAVLEDPSLKIAYHRRGKGTFVDSSGVPVTGSDGRAITWIGRDGVTVAAVMHDPGSEGADRYIHAAGAAATMQLERARLDAELRASQAELAASRIRLVEAADAERRRIERDLHDGVQQQLVGLRIKLDLAAEMLREDPGRGQQALGAVKAQMDDALEELRSLARGIYPPVLHEYGLASALRSIADRSSTPITIRAAGLPRSKEEVELAVYFCCLEALQNIVKHAGPEPGATVTLWQDGTQLRFVVNDSGVGFDSEICSPGNGLTNMRDRIEAVGGTLEVISQRGHGTSVQGALPVA
ncbi:MAG: sensor histidine kinase [Solirubrobacteraceae bacterium]